MLHGLKLSHKMLILVAVPLLFEFGFIIALNQLIEQAEEERHREYVARAVIAHVNEVHRAVLDTASASIGFTGVSSEEREARSLRIRKRLEREGKALDELLKDQPKAQANFQRAKALLEKTTLELRSLRRVLREDGLFAVRDRVKTAIATLGDELDNLLEEEHNAEALSPRVQAEQRQKIKMVLLGGVILNTVMAIVLVVYLNREITGRLKLLMDNSVRLARNLPLNPSLSGNDELTHLDRVFREMASALAIAAIRERAVIENAADMIFSINKAGVFEKVSPASSALLGYSPEEMTDKHYLQFVEDEDREATLQALDESKDKAFKGTVENRMLRADGSQVSTLWSVTWSDADESYFCVAHDITERKHAEEVIREAEARIRQILQSLPLGLVIVTEDGLIEYANRTLEEMFAVKPMSMLGRKFDRVISNDARGQNLPKSVIESALSHSLECVIALNGGAELPVEISFRQIETIDGKRLLGLVLDISERHEMERIKQEFVSMVSHDLRTPLNSVQGYLELLADGIYGDLNQPGLERLSSLSKSIDRLVKLICDLLDLDRLESGAMNLRKQKTSLGAMIEQTVSACLGQAESKGVKLVSPKEDFRLNCDPDRIVQVLVNLVSNAVKFSSEGGTVTLGVEKVGDSVKFQITDQGCGIPLQFQRTIFDRFKQAPEGEDRKMGGTGLGLAICKLIVEQHQGSIGVESEPGKGSTFFFSLPLGEA